MASEPAENLAYVLHGVKDARIESVNRKEQELDPLDVECLPRFTGICGSDTHYLLHGRIGDFVVEKPMILGHESSGIVNRVGSAVTHLKKGDRVALEPGKSCRVCESCKNGFYNRCPEMAFAATPPFDGTLQSYYTLPGDLCYKLPDDMPLEFGALIEPLSVAVHALHKVAQMPHAANVVVFGAGPVGLLCLAVAKALGARKVISVDIQEPRLKFAKEYAADDYFIPSKPKEGESKADGSRRTAEAIRKRFGFEERGFDGVDVVIDATGAPPCIQAGIHLVKHGGVCVQVGMGPSDVELPIATLLQKEVSLKGSFRYGPGVYQLAIDLVARGAVDLKPLITHRYKFKEADEAFKANQEGKGADGKPLIKAIIEGP